jgi:hypothetical protein
VVPGLGGVLTHQVLAAPDGGADGVEVRLGFGALMLEPAPELLSRPLGPDAGGVLLSLAQLAAVRGPPSSRWAPMTAAWCAGRSSPRGAS